MSKRDAFCKLWEIGERIHMKKTYIICIILVVLVLAAGVAGFLLTGSAVSQAEDAQSAVYRMYNRMQDNVAQSCFTVTENGVVIGIYTLDQLGVLADTQAAVDACFTVFDRMEPKQFAGLSVKEKLQWNKQPHPQNPTVSISLEHLDLYAAMEDLVVIPRTAAENAYAKLVNGIYQVHEEVPGTVLQVSQVQYAMTQTLGAAVIDTLGPVETRFEVTDCPDCYLPPEKTVANTFFDFPAMLAEDIRDLTITVDFHGAKETLSQEQLHQVLKTSEKGSILVDEDALRALIGQWAVEYKAGSTPYLLDAYIGGVKPIDFLTVDYDVDEEGLLSLLTETLLEMEDADLEAPWLCWRKGEAFTLGEEYVEIDIPNQTMTYFKDGEVFLTTDVVTGASWGYPTPPGLYKVENKDTDCWLSGEDYNVHVDYWVGFVGYMIGIHDAKWRTKFGGENYIKNGSHGCVNTPTEAMEELFKNIEVGVPVLVYGK